MTNQRGFTLAELLVACAIIAFIMASLLALQQQGQAAYLTGAARVEVQQNARIAVDTMMNELRSALSITQCGAAGPNTITFVDQNGITIAYALNGSDLSRTVAGVAGVVVGGIQALQITCFDANNVPTAVAADVRVVAASVSTRTENGGAGSQTAADQHARASGRTRLRNIL